MTDYLAHMIAERTRLGEEFNQMREKIIQYNGIIRDLQKKAVEDELKLFTEPPFENLTETQRAKLLKIIEIKNMDVVKIRLNHKKRAAIVYDEYSFEYIPYKLTCELLDVKK